jgi:hypothetical protein
LSSFFTFISPFLDPNTRAKVVMLNNTDNVKVNIPLDMLDADFGGQWRYEFNFDVYWSTLLSFCKINVDGKKEYPSKARDGSNPQTQIAETDTNTSTSNNSSDQA